MSIIPCFFSHQKQIAANITQCGSKLKFSIKYKSELTFCSHGLHQRIMLCVFTRWNLCWQSNEAMIICSSRKNPYPLHGRSVEISRGRGILKANILEAKYEAKLEFSGGMGGAKQKNLPCEEYWYFLELHVITCKLHGWDV